MTSEPAPLRIGFILLPGFALMSFASAIEPLRAANLLAARPLFSLRFFADGRNTVSASVGPSMQTEPLPRRDAELDMLLVVAGGDPALHLGDVALSSCLRRMARAGVTIGGISAGPFLLAGFGLLDNRRFTVHWEHASALTERWPELQPERVRYVIDRDRVTCGGGIAPLDMMHALIAARHGADFARKVSDWFLHTHVDAPASPQRASIAERYDIRNPTLVTIIAKMEEAVEQPLSRAQMAAYAQVSERHLDRLFQSGLKSSFRDEYIKIRLERARALLRQSPMKISEIALAAGFSGASQFARAYRRQFSESPGETRRDR